MRQVNLRLSDERLDAVDRARGDVPRNRWIARAIDAALGVSENERLGERTAAARRSEASLAVERPPEAEDLADRTQAFRQALS